MKYPNSINKTYTKINVSHSNRGMNLEDMLNKSNKYYLDNDMAVIYKKPTPIGIVDVSYNDHHKVIKKAYFKEQSTLDYNGLYKGKYIEFDAKETLNKTSFPLSNIHEHQTKQIRAVIKHQGIAFLLIKMNEKYFILTGEDYLSFIDNNDRKSIPYSYIEEKGYIVEEKYNPPLDYLKGLENIYYKGE